MCGLLACGKYHCFTYLQQVKESETIIWQLNLQFDNAWRKISSDYV